LVEIRDQLDSVLVEGEELQRLQAVRAPNTQYTIITKIGQGGWGGVYKAYQHSTKREVALKVLRRDVASDVQARRRFHREAESVSKLFHPHTVTIFDFGETPDGLLFIAMEYLDGRPLDAIIDTEGSVTPLRTVRIARQILLSLAEAHDKGIIHRDIKPQNIMLCPMDEEGDFVKVLDFGVAKLVSDDTTLTSTGSTFGTPEYMSPEQVQSKDVDHRSDLYALGVLMYEMLTGKPPFTGKSAVTVALSHVRRKPPPLSPSVSCPKPLRRLLKRMLAKNPGDRPESARAAARELERVERELATRSTGSMFFLEGVGPRVIKALSANWGAIITVVAVVCLVVMALLVAKERFMAGSRGPPGAGAKEAAPEVRIIGQARSAHQPAPESGLPEARTGVAGRRESPGEAEVPSVAGVPDDGGTSSAGTASSLPSEAADVAEKKTLAIPAVDVSESPRQPSLSTGTQEEGDPPQPPGGQSMPPDDRAGLQLTVELRANVKGATVTERGRKLCVTPCPLKGRKGESRRVKISKSG